MRSILFILFHFLVLITAFGQDSLLTHELPEVVVTATRSAISIHHSPSPVEIVRVSELSVLQGRTVADVLRQSSSVFLQDVGGSAALKTAFLRGTAPQHLLVLVNGARQNSFQSGLVDFSLYPLSGVQRIEIVRGGSSALYGADALGGVVNILTRRPASAFHARLDGAAGSFGYALLRAEAQGRMGSVGVLAGGAREQGRDEFPFRNPAGGESTRRNSDFRKTHVYLETDAPLGEDSELSLSSRVIESDRGIPGSLTFSSDAARQHDEDANINLEFRTSSLPGTQIVVRGAYHYNFQTYVDTNSFFPINARYKNNYLAVNPEAHIVLADNHRVMIGIELDEGTLDGNDFSGTVRRSQKSIYASNELRFVTDREYFDEVSLYGMLRYDDISDVDDVLMPKAGVNVRVSKAWDARLRASYGSSFRSPSFNDLYFIGANNADLRPEYSTTFDAGTTLEVEWGRDRHRLELTYFDIRTRDRILFDLTTFRPVNLGRVVSTGFEGAYRGSLLDEGVDVGLSYTLTEAIKRNRDSDADPAFGKQLLYIPKHTASVFATLHWNPLEINISHSIVGRRFTSSDHSRDLPVHHLTDVSISGRWVLSPAALVITTQVRNIFDRSYMVVPDYPMPGRFIRIGAGLEF